MGSRIREKVERLFEVFVEIAKPKGKDEPPFIIQQYPPEFDDKEALVMIPKFAYPCPTDASKVDHFTFVLTDLEGMFRFGYCRHTTGHQTCLCIVSWLPWFEIFYKMLDLLADITNRSKKNTVTNFLRATYNHEVPLPRVSVTIVANEDMFNFTSPDQNVLPGIPGSRNLTEYFSAVDPFNMMVVFASMLHERRIYMTSKKLSRLTACIHAAEALLYPMHWQHLYIPVLPAHLIDYVSAPMPFLIGVHSNLVEKLKLNRVDVGDAVVVDLDANAVFSEYDDLGNLPEHVSSYLKRNLKMDVVKSNMKTGDAISMAFLHALVRLIGGYRDALKFRRGEPITFDPEAFIRSRSSQSTQTFLEGMLTLQIFQQFIYGRLEILNSGAGFRDLFEQQAILYADKLNSQSKYKEWLKSVKKSGKKGWNGLKIKMKEQGKRAMADFKTKLSGLTDNDERRGSNHQLPTPVAYDKPSKPRPVTAHAENMRRARPPRPPPPSRVTHVEYEKRTKSVVLVQEENNLSYQRVDMNLMSDSDIQAAMLRPACEQRGHSQAQNSSDESDSESSDSGDEADGASTSFDVLHSSSDEGLSSTASSDGSLQKQRQFAAFSGRDDKQIHANPAHVRSDHSDAARRIKSATPSDFPRTSPSPAPQNKTSLPNPSHRPKSSSTRFEKSGTSFDSPTQQDELLIKFDSSDSESFDAALTKSTIESPDAPHIARSTSSESLENRSDVEMRPIQRDITSRVSLTRSRAFRRETPTVPLRPHYLDDNDDLDEPKNNSTTDILDPLSDSSLSSNFQASWQTQHSAINDPFFSHSRGRDSSNLLTHEWSLASLAKGPSIRMPVTEQPRFPMNLSTVGTSQSRPSARQSIASSYSASMHNNLLSEPNQTQNKRTSLDQQRINQSLDKRGTDFSKKNPSGHQQPSDPSKLPNPANKYSLAASYSSSSSRPSSISPRTPGTMNFISPTPSSSTPTVRGSVQNIQRSGGVDSTLSSSSSSEENLQKQPDSSSVLRDVDFDSRKSLNQSKNLGKPDNHMVSLSRQSQPNMNRKVSPSRQSQPNVNHKVPPSRPSQPDINRKVSSGYSQPNTNHKVSPTRPPQPDINYKVSSRNSQPDNRKVSPSRPPQPDINRKVSPPIPSRPDFNSHVLSPRR